MAKIFLIVLLSLVFTGTAQARLPELVPEPGPYQLVAGRCPEFPTYEGCTHLDGTIYLLPGSLQYLAHEEGHLYDWRYLDDSERSQFRRLVRAPASWPWWEQGDEQRFVAEWFADAYATCKQGRLEGWPGFWMGPYVGRGRQVCRFITLSWG